MNYFLENYVSKNESFERVPKKQTLNVDDLTDGVQSNDEFIIRKSGQSITVYDRVCDHAGGRLLTRNGKTICPLHGWEFDANTGHYKNVECSKDPIFQNKVSNQIVKFETYQHQRKLESFTHDREISIRWINHACLLFEASTVKFATDPWVFGPAFSNGWWLKYPSPKNAFDELNQCDFIFISHNHPDHLHPQSLLKIRKDMPILTGAFANSSTEKYLADLGFVDVTALDFQTKLVKKQDEIAFSVLKSGDFREDSGLLVELGTFSALLGVDSNFIDFWRFPKALTMFANSFAGGASGFPLCFDNYSNNQKAQLLKRNKIALIETNRLALHRSRPRYFLPYAGFFAEAATRDRYIHDYNTKNEIKDYAKNCEAVGATLLDVTSTDTHIFFGKSLVDQKQDRTEVMFEPKPDLQIKKQEPLSLDTSRDFVRDYFLKSGFDRLIDLELITTCNSFETASACYHVQFGGKQGICFCSGQEGLMHRRNGVNFLQIKVREDEFFRVINAGLPWEDLSIGFQCRIYREPNIYNSDFWYHFTNIYVNDMVKTRTRDCSGCETISQALA